MHDFSMAIAFHPFGGMWILGYSVHHPYSPFFKEFPMSHFSLTAAFVSALFAFIPAAQAETSPPLQLTTASYPVLSTPAQDGFIDLVTKEMFKRIDLSVNISLIPAERALINVDQGVDDGLVQRVGGLHKQYPRTFHLEEKTMDLDFSAFTRRGNPAITDWQDFAPYSVGLITGWKIYEKNLENHPNLIKVKEPRQLFELLQNGRVDYVLLTKWNGLGIMREMGMSADFMLVEPPLAVEAMYLYLNEKHANLAEPLTKALREIKTDGTYARIHAQTLNPLIEAMK
jgi:polar amino acid transport system substrate-binding protein